MKVEYVFVRDKPKPNGDAVTPRPPRREINFSVWDMLLSQKSLNQMSKEWKDAFDLNPAPPAVPPTAPPPPPTTPSTPPVVPPASPAPLPAITLPATSDLDMVKETSTPSMEWTPMEDATLVGLMALGYSSKQVHALMKGKHGINARYKKLFEEVTKANGKGDNAKASKEGGDGSKSDKQETSTVWTPFEDAALIGLKGMDRSWEDIRTLLNGKTGLRERYKELTKGKGKENDSTTSQEVVEDKIKTDEQKIEWTPLEDATLMGLKTMGKTWKEIHTILEGKSGLKERYKELTKDGGKGDDSKAPKEGTEGKKNEQKAKQGKEKPGNANADATKTSEEKAKEGKEKAEKAKAEKSKTSEQKAKEGKEKAQNAKAEKAKAKAEAEKAKAEAEKAEEEKAAKEKAEMETILTAKAERKKARREKAQQEKAEAEKAEKDKIDKEKAGKEKSERKKAKKEKAEAEKAEKNKAATENIEKTNKSNDGKSDGNSSSTSTILLEAGGRLSVDELLKLQAMKEHLEMKKWTEISARFFDQTGKRVDPLTIRRKLQG